ncbi:hypothetical protein KKF91_18715 [Myxococcota bacterium]|nr:hypothetical protein [Myxococcota bacterium]MBU1432576.1 hypothetical protein [Myxococcota bacterium]MBU1899873.1 hypothetical protein [Myxococcota bacterium]
MAMNRNIAAIDIGSNSIHLTLARVGEREVEIIGRFKDPARLAGELDGDLHLNARSIDKGVATLRRFRELSDVHSACVLAFATATLRKARNRQVFIERAWREAGVKIELISGHAEARLAYRGVLNGLPQLNGARVVCVDVGGGSTEMVIGEGPRVHISASLPVGSLMITTTCLMPDPVTLRDVRQARKVIWDALSPRMEVLRRFGFDHAVATAGTVQRIARIAHRLNGGPRGEKINVHGHTLAREELSLVISHLIRAHHHEQRLCIPAMDPERADTLLGGALIFEALMKGLGVDHWRVSMAAFRTGLILEAFERCNPTLEVRSPVGY